MDLLPHSSTLTRAPFGSPREIEAAPAKAPFLATADRIGHVLCRDAIWSGARCNWMTWDTVQLGGTFTPIFRAADLTFYNGVAGIALFLAQLASQTGDRHQRATRDGAARQVAARLDTIPPDAIGLHGGAAGVAHALLCFGELTGDADAIERGLEVLRRLPRDGLTVGQLDLVSGCAGTIPVLIDAAHRHGCEELLDIAAAHADHLVRHAVHGDAGAWWPAGDGATRGLLGYSHGAAGIACALLEYHRARPEPRLEQLARDALRYERSHFDPVALGWPDFRQNVASGGAHPVAWCHGATGIGLSRLRLLDLLPDDRAALEAELEAAHRAVTLHVLATVNGSVTDFSLCHGLAGNADFLISAARRFGRDEVLANARQIGLLGIEACARPQRPWPCGVPGGGEAAGVMLGRAGIGWFYLRLHDPEIPTPLMRIPRPDSRSDNSSTKHDSQARSPGELP